LKRSFLEYQSKLSAQSEPIASAFTPIAQLEAAIGTRVRSGELRFLVSEPRHGAKFTRNDGKTNFKLSGKMEGRPKLFNTVYSVLIFNNNKQRFETMRTLENQALGLCCWSRCFVTYLVHSKNPEGIVCKNVNNIHKIPSGFGKINLRCFYKHICCP